MSVPVPSRSEGKLEVADRAKGLAAYTLQITKNQNVFDPAQNEGFIDEIRRLSIDIFSKVWEANNIYVKTRAEAEERQRLQRKARQDCNALLPMIEIAGKVFKLKKKRIKYWGGWVIEVRNKIQSWEDSDRLRYSQKGLR